MTWTEFYHISFGRPIGDEIGRLWEERISDAIPALKPGEILAALRSIADTDRRRGDPRQFQPTSEDVISRIIALRGQSAAPIPEPPSGGCAICIRGWMSFIPPGPRPNSQPINPRTLGRATGTATIPCLCPAGQFQAAKLGPGCPTIAYRKQVHAILSAPIPEPIPAARPVSQPSDPPADDLDDPPF